MSSIFFNMYFFWWACDTNNTLIKKNKKIKIEI